jgi:hypothetical protein
MVLGMIRLTQLNKIFGSVIQRVTIYVMNGIAPACKIIGVGCVPDMASTRDVASALILRERYVGPQVPRFINTNPAALEKGRTISAPVTWASRGLVSTSAGAVERSDSN